jgi:hypothetical protein
MISPTGSHEVRGTDKHGSGAFGSNRGARIHTGSDMVVIPGQEIFAPHDCIVRRSLLVYTDSQKWKGLELVGKEHITRLMYVIPKPGIIGQEVKAGDVIGYAQKISERYEEITEHIHWDLFCNPILYL